MTAPTTIALYATDTMADWEYAYLTAEIAGAGHAAELVIVGDGLDPVRSMGGMTVTPDAEIGAVLGLHPDALVLPGADTYADGHEAAANAVRECLIRSVPVAAICGATYLLARLGLLDDRDHTSNAPEFLAASGYQGGERYRRADVVTDALVTTASGLRPVPFTAEVMRVSGLTSREVADAWERLYTTADPADYARYVELTQLTELTETSQPD